MRVLQELLEWDKSKNSIKILLTGSNKKQINQEKTPQTNLIFFCSKATVFVAQEKAQILYILTVFKVFYILSHFLKILFKTFFSRKFGKHDLDKVHSGFSSYHWFYMTDWYRPGRIPCAIPATPLSG